MFTAIWRRSTLCRRITQVNEAYKALRQSEHRASIRLKRAAVRSRIITEMLHAQITKIHALKEMAMASARIDALNEVLHLCDKRRQHVVHAINKHEKGITPPWETASQRAAVGEVPQTPRRLENLTSDDSRINDLRERVLDGIHEKIDAGVAGAFAHKFVQATVEESLQSGPTGEVDTRTANAAGHPSLNIATKLIKELSLSREEVEALISRIEHDHGDSGLRHAVSQALHETRTADCKQCP